MSLRLMILLLLLCPPLLRAEAPTAKPEVDRVSYSELTTALTGETPTFPTYTTQLINLANQNSQATRPRHVGQLSELIQTFPGETYAEWESWYLEQHPDTIEEATDRIHDMLKKVLAAGGEIDREMIHTWVRDLVLTKTYAGLRAQEGILRYLAERRDVDWRLATPEEEAQGIDGWLGDLPVSVKPESYKSKPMLPEDIQVHIISYRKVSGGLRLEHTLP